MRPVHWIALILLLFSTACDFRSREAAKRKQMRQNLKALSEALHNYSLPTESADGGAGTPTAEAAAGTPSDDATVGGEAHRGAPEVPQAPVEDAKVDSSPEDRESTDLAPTVDDKRGSEADSGTDSDPGENRGGSASALPSRDEKGSVVGRKVFSLSAKVAELKLCPAGLVDCIRLADGRSVHFPSQSADAVRSVATVGALLEVTGWQEAGSDTLHATVILNPKNSESLEVDFVTPAPERDLPRK